MINKDLLRKFGIVIIGLLIFRMGSHIPVPGVDPVALALMFDSYDGTIFDMMNTFSGGSLKRLSVFAIGVMPYISASITIQILTLFFKSFKEIKNDGLKGQLKIAQYTRNLTILIATVQAIGLTQTLKSQIVNGMPIIPDQSILFQIGAVLTLVAGTFALVWIGEKITEYGIGNGLSLIIFASIISNIPLSIQGTIDLVKNGELSSVFGVLVLALVLATLVIVVTMEKSQRRIPVANSKGDGLHSHKSFLPFKVNMAGILPPIIASSLMLLPSTLGLMLSGSNEFSFLQKISVFFAHGSYIYLLSFTALIIAFSYMFNSLQHNPFETAKKLKENGTFIDGIRPGHNTGLYLKKMMSRLTFIGSVYLALICIIPEILIYSWNIPFYFGGTSILIMVMVALEWQNQINSHLRKNNYKNIREEISKAFE